MNNSKMILKFMSLSLIMIIFASFMPHEKDNSKDNSDDEELRELINMYMQNSHPLSKDSVLYFCVGVHILNNDTIIGVHGGVIEEYWAGWDSEGNYHEIAPNILYRKFGKDVVTFYPSDEKLSKWVQHVYNCYPIDPNSVKKDPRLKHMNYCPIELTFRYKTGQKLEFLHSGFY